MADVFLCYDKHDAGRVAAIAEGLRGQGFTVWWDLALAPGRQMEQTLTRELAAARCVVVVWSEVSINSPWVKHEAAAAQSRGALVSVRLDYIEPPTEFAYTQAPGLWSWNGDTSDPQWNMFVASIRSTLSRQPVPAGGPQPQGWSFSMGVAIGGGAALALMLVIGLAFLIPRGGDEPGPQARRLNDNRSEPVPQPVPQPVSPARTAPVEPPARAVFEKAYAMRSEVPSTPMEAAERLAKLAEAYEAAGDAEQADGNVVGARKVYEKALSVRTRLVAMSPNNFDRRSDMATAHARLLLVAEPGSAEEIEQVILLLASAAWAGSGTPPVTKYLQDHDWAIAQYQRVIAPDPSRGPSSEVMRGMQEACDYAAIFGQGDRATFGIMVINTAIALAQDGYHNSQLAVALGQPHISKYQNDVSLTCNLAEATFGADLPLDQQQGAWETCISASQGDARYTTVAHSFLLSACVLQGRASCQGHADRLRTSMTAVKGMQLGWQFGGTKASLARRSEPQARTLIRLYDVLEVDQPSERIQSVEPLLQQLGY